MRLGFTGTQKGMTTEQQWALATLGVASYVYVSEFHHGDCIGSDAEAHDLALTFAATIVIHPGTDADGGNLKRAFCGDRPVDQNRVQVLPPKPYLERNADIVDATDELVATPEGPETLRSGTWSTVRKARRERKPVTIIYPDGTIVREEKHA